MATSGDSNPSAKSQENYIIEGSFHTVWVKNGPSVASGLRPFIPRQRTSPACPWGGITYLDLHGMEGNDERETLARR
jgi:hypothetical protein